MGSTVSGRYIQEFEVRFPFWVLVPAGSSPATATWEFGKVLLRHSFMAADLSDCSLVTRGEHGNFRYAPRGLREQHEDVVGICRRRFESYYLNGGARCVK